MPFLVLIFGTIGLYFHIYMNEPWKNSTSLTTKELNRKWQKVEFFLLFQPDMKSTFILVHFEEIYHIKIWGCFLCGFLNHTDLSD